MGQLILTKFNNLPSYIQQQVLDYIEVLLAKQESRTAGQQAQKEGKSYVPPDGKGIPEPLKIAMQYEGTAPYPNVLVSKYDWYEQ